jgi:DnaJ family protein C protein 7
LFCRYNEAITDCTKALQLEPNNLKAYIRWGKAQLSLGDIESAIATLTRATTLEPRDEVARAERQQAVRCQHNLKLVHQYIKSGDADRCTAFIKSLVEHCPGASFQWGLLKVESLMRGNKLDDAYNLTTELMTGKPSTGKSTLEFGGDGETHESDTKLLVLRAKILQLKGNTVMAMKHLQEILRIDPDAPEAGKLFKLYKKLENLKTVGNDAFKAGNMQAAVDAYTECLSVGDPTDNPSFASKIFANRAAAYIK